MFRERLIESFTLLFVEVEVLLLERIDIDFSNKEMFNEFTRSTFHQVLCYLANLEYRKNTNGKGNFDYLETLDFLSNKNQSDKIVINREVMLDYSESDILGLIENTVKLIQFLKVIE
jgi:hypothetical protein